VFTLWCKINLTWNEVKYNSKKSLKLEMVFHKERSMKTTVIKFNLTILVFVFITLHLTLFIIVMSFSPKAKKKIAIDYKINYIYTNLVAFVSTFCELCADNDSTLMFSSKASGYIIVFLKDKILNCIYICSLPNYKCVLVQTLLHIKLNTCEILLLILAQIPLSPATTR